MTSKIAQTIKLRFAENIDADEIKIKQEQILIRNTMNITLPVNKIVTLEITLK